MADPLSITTSVLPLVEIVLKVSVTIIGVVDKTTAAHEHHEARDALKDLRRALQNLNKETSTIQGMLRILISDLMDNAVLVQPEGEVAVKELCESLESTRGLLAEWAGQAQRETTALEPLPQDRRSLAFVQAVFKHNLSPSNIEDAVIALKDFHFEVESCQQTTELAFQQVWRIYEIVKSQTIQRRSSVSTISSISTQTSESSTRPQTTTGFRKETIDWLKGLVAPSKTNSETPNSATQSEREARAGIDAALTSTLSPPFRFPPPRLPSPPPSPSSPPWSRPISQGILTVLVTCPYEALDDSEINLIEGEYIYEVEPFDDGWWRGTSQDGERGMFPANYVEECAAPSNVEVKRKPKRNDGGDDSKFFEPPWLALDNRWGSRSWLQEPW